MKRVGVKWVKALIRVRGTHSRTPTLLLPAVKPLAQLACLLACFPSFLPASSRFRQPPRLARSPRSCETDHNRRNVKVWWGCPALPWLRSFWSPISALRTRGSRGSFPTSFRNPPPWLSCPESKCKPFSFLPPSYPNPLLPLLLLLHHFPQYLSQILLYPPSSGPHVSRTPTASFK